MKKRVEKAKTSGLFWIWIAIAIIAFDRLSKLYIASSLMLAEPLRILPILNFTLAYNRGAAFSFLHNASGWQNIFFTTLACIVSVIIIAWLYRVSRRDWWSCIGLNLVLGGAIGNAWDRLQYGYVIDFIHFHLGNWSFAIFNVADSAICVGATMLILCWVWQQRVEGVKNA